MRCKLVVHSCRSSMWAGPYASCFLADMGADVIKVESIQRPDGMRLANAVPREPVWEWAHVFAGANPGKRDITLNLTSEEGVALLKRLIANADVVMEAYAVRVVGRSAALTRNSYATTAAR
ncbi:MAG: CoA transferase [Candidatus Binatia bacterium]